MISYSLFTLSADDKTFLLLVLHELFCSIVAKLQYQVCISVLHCYYHPRQAFLIAFTSEFLPRLLYKHEYDYTLSGYVNFTLATAPNNTFTEECR